MEKDPQTLVCLLALRQLGGQGVPAKQDLFTKGLKPTLQKALELGLVRAEQATVQVVGKNGKPKSSKIDVLHLTAEGDTMLRQAADPEALAASAAGEMVQLRQRLEADHQSFRGQLQSALLESNKAKPANVGKDLAALTKTVGDLAKKLEKLEAQVQGSGQDGVLSKIDHAFAQLLARLDSGKTSTIPAAAPTPPAPGLREILEQAYKDLCQLIEYEDKIVPLNRLYHQAKHLSAGLRVPAFHQELLKLWEERVLELKILNEVREATEPDLGIRQGDNLLYFVLWKSS